MVEEARGTAQEAASSAPAPSQAGSWRTPEEREEAIEALKEARRFSPRISDGEELDPASYRQN